jgi:hypothetical protein
MVDLSDENLHVALPSVIEDDGSAITRVHILSMKIGKPHLGATGHVLEIRTRAGIRPAINSDCVAGNFFGVLLGRDDENTSELLIWQWRLGSLHFVS